MPVNKLVEKPDGARNVETWDVHIERSYERQQVLVEDKNGVFHVENYYNDSPSLVWLDIRVKFLDDQSARDFEDKVRAMLPEVEYLK